MVVAPFINFVPAFGEEYGWRGFLLIKLKRRWGVAASLMLTGLIWGLWHTLIYLHVLMGYSWQDVAVSQLLSVFNAMFIGFFLGWLRLRSENTFPPALCHGAINAYLGLALVLAPGIPVTPSAAVIAVLAYLDLRTMRPEGTRFPEGVVPERVLEVTPWVKVSEREKTIFFAKLADRLRNIRTFTEQIEITEQFEEETPDGASIVHVRFNHRCGDDASFNDLMGVKRPGEHFYRLKLESKPAKAGVSETFINRTKEIVRELILDITGEQARKIQ